VTDFDPPGTEFFCPGTVFAGAVIVFFVPGTEFGYDGIALGMEQNSIPEVRPGPDAQNNRPGRFYIHQKQPQYNLLL
jgi:hypothetical protein